MSKKETLYICMVMKASEYRSMMEIIATNPEEKKTYLELIKTNLSKTGLNVLEVDFVNYLKKEWEQANKRIDFYWFNFDKDTVADQLNRVASEVKFTPRILKVLCDIDSSVISSAQLILSSN